MPATTAAEGLAIAGQAAAAPVGLYSLDGPRCAPERATDPASAGL